MDLPFVPEILLLGLYSKNPESPIQKDPCTIMFIAALFTITKCWKQPKCSPLNKWIKKLWYIYKWNSTQQKEGTPTFRDSMHGIGEYYAK